MSRPGVGPDRRRGAVVLGALLLTLAGPDSLSAASAFPIQSYDGDETQQAGAARESPEAALTRDREPLPARGDGSEQRAQQLYLRGLKDLDGGHRDLAQRTFEMVITSFPESAAATLARGRLGGLYRGAPAKGSADAAVAPPALSSDLRNPPSPAPASAPGRGPQWGQELRRNAAIQAKLRDEAGDRIFFSSGSDELGTRARIALAAQAQWLNRWREFEVAVEGHADEPGTEEENLTLSRQRAEAVRQRLIEEGVEPSRISVVAAGRSERVATCAAPDCSSQNRRAVTLVFASGTRLRLGLAGPATADASNDRAPALAPAKAVAPPPFAQQVGVTR